MMSALSFLARVAGFLLVLGFLSLPARALTPDETALWRADLRFMAREMEAAHKDLFHAIPRERFAAMVEALDAGMPSLARHEVIVEMAKIVAAVGDGHTNIYPTRDPKIGFQELPVAFTFFGDGLYVRAADQSHRRLVGARVVRIGDTDVTAAYAAVKTMIGRENEQAARYWAQYLLAIPEVLHALRLAPAPESTPLTLEIGGRETRVVLRPAGPVQIMTGDIAPLFNRRPGWTDLRDLAGAPDPVWLAHTGEPFRFERLGTLLYVQINTVNNGEAETLADFSRRLHDEIAATSPEKVAIDLRLNRGGNGGLIRPLIRSIVQSESIDRPGRLFGIIGPATFSAAQMLTDELEKYTAITFVGEPTGSRGNAFGDSRRIVLPNSGITVRVSVFFWQYWHPLDKREATTPKIPAPLTLDAYRRNADPALEAVKLYVP